MSGKANPLIKLRVRIVCQKINIHKYMIYIFIFLYFYIFVTCSYESMPYTNFLILNSFICNWIRFFNLI